jgi:hypothetical protein
VAVRGHDACGVRPSLNEAMTVWAKMHDPSKDEVAKFLTQRHLADRWGCSERTLQRWRTMAVGPAFVRLGGSVRYRLTDVLAFEDRSRMSKEEA